MAILLLLVTCMNATPRFGVSVGFFMSFFSVLHKSSNSC